MQLDGLGRSKNPMTSSGIEPRDIRACSVVLQPTALPRAASCIYKFSLSAISIIYVEVVRILEWKQYQNHHNCTLSYVRCETILLYE
jgi:hypothetical protein